MNGRKLENNESLKFIFVGKSTVTFMNRTTENRFTFRVKMAKDSNLFFVSLLRNTDKYEYLGTVVEGVYTHGRKSTISVDSQSTRVFQYVINKLKLGNLPDTIEIWHEGTCGKCGRPLTVPSSIASGIGPECIKSYLNQIREIVF